MLIITSVEPFTIMLIFKMPFPRTVHVTDQNSIEYATSKCLHTVSKLYLNINRYNLYLQNIQKKIMEL